jgi:hypothetical protein
MIVTAALSALCIGSIGFYLRFLAALCKECRRSWISYLVRLEPEYEEYTIYEEPKAEHSLPRAA